MDGGNAFTNPSTGKIDQQRKILEELAREKKLIKSGNSSLGMSATPSSSIPEGPTHGTVGRALETASKTSYGYFIQTDSAFGNVILPVIPRIPPPAKTTK